MIFYILLCYTYIVIETIAVSENAFQKNAFHFKRVRERVFPKFDEMQQECNESNGDA